MNLKQLKEALLKFDSDLDDSEIFLITECSGQRAYDLLAATGYILVGDTGYVALISQTEAKKELLKT